MLENSHVNEVRIWLIIIIYLFGGINKVCLLSTAQSHLWNWRLINSWIIFDFKAKHELGSMIIFGLEANFPVKLLHDHFANDQTQAYSLGLAPTFWVFDRAEHFEKLRLIFFLDAYSGISNSHNHESIGIIHSLYLNTALTIREFYSIRNQIQQNLLKPLLIDADQVVLCEAN